VSVELCGTDIIKLAGDCPVEDAELLLQYLVANPNARVDWNGCTSAHTAVVQVLLVAGVTPAGEPHSILLRDVVAPLLKKRE